MFGENVVKMSGFVKFPKLTTTQNGYPKFTGSVNVPVRYERNGETIERFTSYRLVGWGSVAEGLGELIDGIPIEINGHLNVRSYDGVCKHCGQTDKKYWSEVQVDSFIIPDVEGY